MHYLLATWDGGGTVPIDLGIARALVDRGHTVTALADPTMAAEVVAAGAAFVPWREAPHRRSTAPEDDILKDWEVRRRPIALLRRVSDRLLTGPAAAFARETDAEIGRRRPDVVLVDAAILGPMIAAEAAGLPTVAIVPGCYILPTPGGPPFGLGLRPAAPRWAARPTTSSTAPSGRPGAAGSRGSTPLGRRSGWNRWPTRSTSSAAAPPCS